MGKLTIIEAMKLLELPSGANEEDLKKAYRKMGKKYHPDNVSTGDEMKFKEIAEAKKIVQEKIDLYGTCCYLENMDGNKNVCETEAEQFQRFCKEHDIKFRDTTCVVATLNEIALEPEFATDIQGQKFNFRDKKSNGELLCYTDVSVKYNGTLFKTAIISNVADYGFRVKGELVIECDVNTVSANKTVKIEAYGMNKEIEMRNLGSVAFKVGSYIAEIMIIFRIKKVL